MIEPYPTAALTPEEWDRTKVANGATVIEVRIGADEIRELPNDQRHRLAALCLYGQDFGFTQHDVDILLGIDHYNAGARDAVEVCEWLADRIAALLPPVPKVKKSRRRLPSP